MTQVFLNIFPAKRRRKLRRGVAVLAAILSTFVILTGCTAPGYKLAPKKTLPPVMINLPSTEPPLEALLHTVIVYRGPGSWKRNAYWDEYVVTIVNRGNASINVTSTLLTDFRGQSSEAGANPWDLEATSRSLASKGFGFATNSAVQIGSGVTVVTAGAGLGAYLLGTGGFTVLPAAAIGGAVVLPAFLIGTIYSNVSNHNAIVREFNRRRLNFPIDLLPGQLAQGSLFFRISPGPVRLTLKCLVDDQPQDFVIDLAPLAGLHFKTPPPPSKESIVKH